MQNKMKDSGIDWIGLVPESWTIGRNKNYFYCTKQIVGKESSTTQLLSLTTKGVKLKSETSSAGKVPESFDTYQVVRKNDLIMCLFDLDCSAVFSGLSPYDGMVSPAYRILKCKNNMDPEYADLWFSYVFDGRKFQHYSKSLRYTLNYDEFSALPILVPDIKTQKNICKALKEKIEKIDLIIDKTEKSMESYKLLRQAVVSKAVCRGIGKRNNYKYSGDEWFGNIPDNWEMKKIKYHFHIKKDIAGEEGYTVLSITQKGIIPKDLSKNEGQLAENYSKYQLVEPGDFAMNHMDLLTGWVDISSYSGVTSPDYRVFVIDDAQNNNSRYFLYLMQMCYSNKIFYGLGQGVSGMGRWRLQADKFLNFKIPIPPLEEQNEIVRYLDEKCKYVDSLVARKERFVEELKEYRKTVIYEYITGKREVPDCY